jgi:hypothetical protein
MGAGASCSYAGSVTGQKPPLASNLFARFFDLDISEDPHVIIGNLVNYVRDTRGIPPELFFTFDENAESFLTELDDAVNHLAPLMPKIKQSKRRDGGYIFVNFAALASAYDQTVWLFARVLNEIQNGDLCAEYLELVRRTNEEDVFLTFNWDTLLDRCLFDSGEWFPDTGYGIRFLRVFDRKWRAPRRKNSSRILLKLHGSTNWLVPYLSRSLEDGSRSMLVPERKKGFIGTFARLQPIRRELPDGSLEVTFKPVIRHGPAFTTSAVPLRDAPSIRPICFVQDDGEFETYADRYKGGYKPFSYYYPPNHPVTRAPTMPLIIPPTKRKLYTEFGFVFAKLWRAAERHIRSSDELVIVGFSFPDTDTRARKLLRDAIRCRKRPLEITVVDPGAKDVIAKISGFLPKRAFVIKAQFPSFSDFLAAP